MLITSWHCTIICRPFIIFTVLLCSSSYGRAAEPTSAVHLLHVVLEPTTYRNLETPPKDPG